MFTVNISTQKLTDTEKILALGEPENLAKMDFVLVDAAGQPVNAENCQFDLMMGEVNCPRYKTDANTVSFRYIALEITKAQTEFTVTLKKDGVTICNDSIKVTAEVQGSGSSEVQGIVYDNVPAKVTTVQIIPETLTADWTDFSSMFYRCSALTSVPALNTSSGTDFNNMFQSCSNLTTIPAFDTSKGTDFSSMFASCSKLTTIPALDTSNGTNFSNMFYYCSKLTTIPALDTSNGTDFSNMFQNCSSLTSIPTLDTSKGTNFYNMFNFCSKITTIPAFDTSKGTSFSYMFAYCSKLTTIEGIDFSGATSAIQSTTFQNCSALTSVKVNGIIPVAIDISQAPNLDLTSLNSFCNALQTKTSGVYYLTLKQTQYDKISSSTINSVKNKGWGFKIA